MNWVGGLEVDNWNTSLVGMPTGLKAHKILPRGAAHLGGSGSWGQWRDGLTGDRTVPLSETFSQMENKRWAGINERKTMAFHCQS